MKLSEQERDGVFEPEIFRGCKLAVGFGECM